MSYALAPIGDVPDALVVLPRRALGETVIFANKYDRKLPQRSDVDPFVEGSFVAGPVTEKTDHNVFRLFKLDSQGGAGGDGNSSAHDSVRPKDAEVLVGNVHRTAFPLAVSGFPCVKLGEHALVIESLGNHVSMAAVRRGDLVFIVQMGAKARRDGFLADAGVEKSGKLARRK